MPTTVHIRLADLSAQWLRRERGTPTPRGPLHYRAMAQSLGWLTAGARVDTVAVGTQLQAHFGRRLLDDAGVKFEQKRSAWPFLMLRPGVDIQFPPIKHVLMEALLERRLSDGAPTLDHAHGSSASPPQLLDAFYSALARAELKEVLRRGLLLTTEQFLRRVGCFSQYRRHRRRLPQLSIVVREFRSSPATTKRLERDKRLYLSEPAP